MSTDARPGTVSVRDFAKWYGPHRQLACTGVDFTAEAGGVTCLAGENGAGKTTLLKALCGVLAPSEGTVSVCGETDGARLRERVGFVPEVPDLPGRLTVQETLFFEALLAPSCTTDSQARDLAATAARDCGLSDVLFRRNRQLSKGYRQRVSFARALSRDVDVLVLDEFSEGLDPSQLARMKSLIKRLSAQKTVIISTHHIAEIQSLCTTLYIMHRGRIAAHGSVPEILQKAGTRTLEDAFLALTEAADA